VAALDALGELPEQRLHDIHELGLLRDLEHLLKLVHEEHLLAAVSDGPEL